MLLTFATRTTVPEPATADAVSVTIRDPRTEGFDRPASADDPASLADDLRWLRILHEAFGHDPLLLIARRDGAYAGHLPLCGMRSALFGKFLVSLPYLNTGGIRASDRQTSEALIDAAVVLADRRDVKFLELRHEAAIAHPALTEMLTSKVHMRLALPSSPGELMASLKSKRRSQLRNGLTRGFGVRWGGLELVPDFYAVFSRNMRDLGTPVYGIGLFRAILTHLGPDAELCCLYDGRKPIAAGLLVHRESVTEVPSASALRAYNPANVNMAMYWHLLERAVLRGQTIFDFGRSTIDGPTFAFKKQWGAEPHPANWQYHVRRGRADVGRPDNGRYGLAIRLWTKLPVRLANRIGPRIVRGIP